MLDSMNKLLKGVLYFVMRYVCRRSFLTADCPKRSVRMKFKTEDAVGRTMFKTGDYESAISDFVSRIELRPGEVAFDVGANIGWYSVLIAAATANRNTVYAFEPDAFNFNLLYENVSLNGASSVLPVRLAVGEESCTKTLFKYPSKNLGRHSLLPIGQDGSEMVECVALDDFCLSRGIDPARVAFLKIDVEGYEMFVIRGASTVLQHARVVVTEYIPKQLAHGGVQGEDFIDSMGERGFEPHLVEEGRLCLKSREQIKALEACDIIWMRGTSQGGKF
jgi:FkbM family methyltransferase